jgi:hypothetical protein
MAKIAVDIDSTLYDFETPAREAFFALAEKYDDPTIRQGAYHPWTEWRSPADVCGVPIWLEAIALCHDADAILQQVPFAGAVETCQALAYEGHELLYISNRATEAEDATYEWLVRNGFLNSVLSACPGLERAELVVTTGDKTPYMRDCQYLIDDRLKTCVEFVYDFEWRETFGKVVLSTDGTSTAITYPPEQARKAFVKAYQYNQAATDIPGLYLAPTWSGLNIYLQSKGVLKERAVLPTLKV